MAKRVRADMILRQLEKRHNGKLPDAFFAEVKNGPSWNGNNLLKLDAVAFRRSWAKPCITGYEIKVTRQDFLRDEKWPGYRQYCHRFYFACPIGLITPDELPDDVGLIYYNPDNDCISTKKQAAFRPVEIPVEMLYYLVIYRVPESTHPFFSSAREYLEAWVQDKVDRKELGRKVQNKMVATLDEFEKKAERAERKLKSLDYDQEELEKLKAVMRLHNISSWNVVEALDEALRSGVPRRLVNSLKTINREATWLIEALEGKEKAANG